ncbi:MAG: bacterial transcriptional activator domain-containing protein, partial [Dehalococcoidia bacterium]
TSAPDAEVPAEPEAITVDGDPVVGRSADRAAAGPSNGSGGPNEVEKPVDERADGPGPTDGESMVTPVEDQRTAATAPDGAGPSILSSPPPAGKQVATVARDLLPTPTRQEALLFTDDPVEAPSEPEVAVAKTPVLVHCLGRLRVLVDGAEVTAWPYDKGRELLALLVARGGASVSRQEAADALWPDLPWDASVKHMMSNAATALRAALRTAAGRSDVQPVILTSGRYVLQHGVVRSDLDVFDLALRRAASLPDNEALHYYERALAIYEGDFLEAEPFAWLETYQAEYQRRYLAGARRAGEIAIELGDVERARRFFRAAVERLPTDEEAARGLMRCCAAAGDRNGVRKTYHTLAAALQEALDAPDTAPSAETRALLTELTAEATVG